MLPHRHTPMIIWFGLLLYSTWGVLLWWEPSIRHITALYLFPHKTWVLSGLLLGACACTLRALYTPAQRLRILLMLPQQCLMVLSALGAMHAAWAGQYGDGVLHPRLFILADQWSLVLLVGVHTWAVFAIGDPQRCNGKP